MKRFSVALFAIVIVLTLNSDPASAGELSGGGLKFGLNVAHLNSDYRLSAYDSGIEMHATNVLGEDIRSDTTTYSLENTIEKFDAKRSSVMGFCIGGFITYNLNDYIAIQPEILYSAKGSKWEFEDELEVYTYYPWEEETGGTTRIDTTVVTYSGEQTIKMNYVDIPILVKITLPTGKKVVPNFFFGPTFSINLSAKNKTVITDFSPTKKNVIDGSETYIELSGTEYDFNDSEDFIKYDVGWTFGGGLNYELGKGMATFETRYTRGLMSISEQYEIWNGALSFMLGYTYKF